LLNLSRQGNDVITMFALGAHPMQIFASQAGQVYDALEQGQGGVRGSLKAAGEAVLGLVTKFPLATAALAAAGVAFVAYEMIGGTTVKTLDKALSEHSATIKDLREAYGIAGDGADDYARRSISAIESAQRRAEAALRDSVAAAEKAAKAGLSDSGGFSGFGLLQRMGLLGDNDLNAVKAKFAAFAEPINKLRDGIRAGKPDFDAFQQSLDDIASANPSLRPIADEITGIIQPAADGRQALDNMSVALDQLTSAQIDTANIVAQINNIEAAAFAANAETHAFLTMLNSMNSMVTGKGDAVGGKGSMDRAQASFNEQLEMYRRFGHDNDSGIDPNKPKAAPKTRAARAPVKTADDRFANDLQAIKDRTAALAQEAAMVGLSDEEQTKRSTALGLEQQALKEVREEARKKGDADWQNAQLTPETIAKIDAQSAALAHQKEVLKEVQEQYDFQKDVLKGVFDDLRSALDDGKLDWADFGKIAEDVLDKIIDKIETDLVDAILEAGNAGGGGGGILGQALGFLTGGGGGAATSGKALADIASGSWGAFDTGGFTGPGGKNQPAGIVHKGEYVFDQDAVKRIGVGNLAMLQRGYANGGLVGAPSLPRIQAPAGQGGGAQQVNINVNVTGANGDDHIVALVQQGVSQGINQYDKGSMSRTVGNIRKAKPLGLLGN
jgi:hypothetical protein